MTTATKTRTTKTYTVKHPVDIVLGIGDDFTAENRFYQTLHSISSTDPIENDLIGDGEFTPWDSGVEFTNEGLKIQGADGPSGGSDDATIILIVPQSLIRSITTEQV